MLHVILSLLFPVNDDDLVRPKFAREYFKGME
jgi:hypothetical protein